MIKIYRPYIWHVHRLCCVWYVFQSGEIHINNRKNISLSRWNSQLDPQCQTWTHIFYCHRLFLDRVYPYYNYCKSIRKKNHSFAPIIVLVFCLYIESITSLWSVYLFTLEQRLEADLTYKYLQNRNGYVFANKHILITYNIYYEDTY